MTPMETEFLDLVDEEVKKLRRERGDVDPKGVESTQVKGLAIAVAKALTIINNSLKNTWQN